MDLLVAAVAVFLGQVTFGVTGFGSALVALPLLMMVWSPAEAIGVVVLLDIVGGCLLVPPVRDRVLLPLLAVCLVGLFPGQWVGTALLAALPGDLIRRLLGVVLLPIALDVLLRPVRAGRGEWTALPQRPGRVLLLGAVAGSATGLMSGTVGAGGPPIVVFTRHFFARETFRAQLIATFWIAAFPLAGLLWWRGLLPAQTWSRAGMLLPAVAAGIALGRWLFGRLPATAFGRVVGGVLLASAITLLVS